MDPNLKIVLGVGIAGVVAYYLWPSPTPPPRQMIDASTTTRQPVAIRPNPPAH